MKRKRDDVDDEAQPQAADGVRKKKKKTKVAEISSQEESSQETSTQEKAADDAGDEQNGKASKAKKRDPNRMWKRDRVNRDFAVLQKQQQEEEEGDEEGTKKKRAKDGNSAAEMSIQYLHQWKNDRSSWSFRKVRQVWLLKNMFDRKKIGKSDFKILVAYLSGLKGAARQKTFELAQAIVDGEEEEGEEVEDENAEESKAAEDEGDAEVENDNDDEEDKERKEEEKRQEAKRRAKEQRCRMKRAAKVLRELA